MNRTPCRSLPRPIPTRAPESSVQAQIVELLDRAGWKVFRMNSGTIRTRGRTIALQKAGTSDLMARKRGYRVLWIEVKARDGVRSPDQILFGAEMEVMGDRVIVAWCVDDVAAALGAGEKMEAARRRETRG